jgi:autotransporter-associated beta strand protein
LSVNSAVAVNLVNAGALGSGAYKLIDYTTLSGSGSFPGGSFSVGNRATATIVNNAVDTSIDLNITTDTPKWTGLDSGQWLVGSTGANNNWKLGVSGTATDYLDDDFVLFDDTAAGTKAIVIDSSSVFPASTIFDTATSDYTLAGTAGIASGSLTKSGTGSVTITNANTYTGATTINAGTLQFGNGTLDGSIANTASVANNGTLSYNLTADQTGAYPISGTGNLTKTGAGILTLSGANTSTGGSSLNGGMIVLVANGSLGTGSIALAAGTTLNVNKNLPVANVVTGAGAIVNTGSFTNTGDFTGFSGSFTHNSSVVSVAFNSASTTSQNAAYHIASDQGSAQGLIAGGNGDYTLKLGSLSGVANSLFRGGFTATGTTTLEIGNLGTDTLFAGLITNGTNKIIALTKLGSGTLTLSGASTYSGATLVSGGTLSVTGSLGASSAVTVDSGATLKGTGTVAGTVAGSGTIAPGTSAGTLTTGPATLTGTLAIEIDGATGDKLVSTGAIDLTGSALTVTELTGGFTEASYVIAEGTGITGTFASVPSGYTVNIVSGGAGQQAVLTSNASGYASWATTNAAGQAADLDSDSDGVENGIEYFMNAAAGFTASPGIAAGAVTWPNGGKIPASAYGTQFVVQTSPNLSAWTDVPVGDLTTNTSSTLTYTLPTGSGTLFVRLVVTPN